MYSSAVGMPDEKGPFLRSVPLALFPWSSDPLKKNWLGRRPWSQPDNLDQWVSRFWCGSPSVVGLEPGQGVKRRHIYHTGGMRDK